ncbi:unnamed protein product [Larinioides sclopetarius]|uniref:Dihydroorotate dehydrogenase (quinone), mitochondrial n=1 Tax=Larinioides sclopetarius TaxID=280406 RepID=A0AAV2APD5_9ARAC
MAILSAGGITAFATISLYQGNEKFYKNVAMPSLHFFFSPETSQNIGIMAAKWALIPKCKVEDGPLLKTSLWGLEFSNPIGIAAGLDKNAQAPSGLFRCGIGFLEVGTVTPVPQDGNPKPRIFSLPEDEALINRCGFNSKGHEYVKKRLVVRDKRGILGVNLGKNKESESAEEDYVQGIKEFSFTADYLTVNVSSPNTPGLRSLQKKKELENLLDKISMQVLQARDQTYKKPPILLKISPDLTYEEKEDIASVVMRKKVDGLIISNTTVSRPESLKGTHKNETGGLSGKPLKGLSTEAIKDMYKLTKGNHTICLYGRMPQILNRLDLGNSGIGIILDYKSFQY